IVFHAALIDEVMLGIEHAIAGAPIPVARLPHFFFSSRRRHTRSVSAFLLNRSSDLFINTMKNINHTRSSISDDIRNILCSSANMRRAIPLILRLLMNSVNLSTNLASHLDRKSVV